MAIDEIDVIRAYPRNRFRFGVWLGVGSDANKIIMRNRVFGSSRSLLQSICVKNDARTVTNPATPPTARIAHAASVRCRPRWLRESRPELRSDSQAAHPTRRHWSRPRPATRSEEHTSELQSHHDLVCRLLLEKKKKKKKSYIIKYLYIINILI